MTKNANTHENNQLPQPPTDRNSSVTACLKSAAERVIIDKADGYEITSFQMSDKPGEPKEQECKLWCTIRIPAPGPQAGTIKQKWRKNRGQSDKDEAQVSDVDVVQPNNDKWEAGGVIPDGGYTELYPEGYELIAWQSSPTD